jgi:hypothetical protein
MTRTLFVLRVDLQFKNMRSCVVIVALIAIIVGLMLRMHKLPPSLGVMFLARDIMSMVTPDNYRQPGAVQESAELHGLNAALRGGQTKWQCDVVDRHNRTTWSACAQPLRDLFQLPRNALFYSKTRLSQWHELDKKTGFERIHSWVVADGVRYVCECFFCGCVSLKTVCRNDTSTCLIIQFHGGGTVAGTSAMYTFFYEALSRATYVEN